MKERKQKNYKKQPEERGGGGVPTSYGPTCYKLGTKICTFINFFSFLRRSNMNIIKSIINDVRNPPILREL
jgi:hypothetical protein